MRALLTIIAMFPQLYVLNDYDVMKLDIDVNKIYKSANNKNKKKRFGTSHRLFTKQNTHMA